MKQPSDYAVKKLGDNYGLYFRGSPVPDGVFATRKTANKHKRIAENERRVRMSKANPALPSRWTSAFVRRLPNGQTHIHIPARRRTRARTRRRKR